MRGAEEYSCSVTRDWFGRRAAALLLLALSLRACGGDTNAGSGGTGGSAGLDASDAQLDGSTDVDAAPDTGPPVICDCPADFPATGPQPGTPCNCANTIICGKLVCPAGEQHTLHCNKGVWEHMVAWDYYCPPDAGPD